MNDNPFSDYVKFSDWNVTVLEQHVFEPCILFNSLGRNHTTFLEYDHFQLLPVHLRPHTTTNREERQEDMERARKTVSFT